MSESPLPPVLLLDGAALRETKERLARHDPALAAAYARLRREADAALTAGPFSVMDKTAVPPSGDKHDYMSLGPYWWPDPARPDGKPYIRRDGETNPERDALDRRPLGLLCQAVTTLALAAYLGGERRYADHAAYLLRVWFLDPATRMNPHLRFGQAIPGRCDGRGIGIIDTAQLTSLLDGVCLLRAVDAWPESDQAGLVAWFSQYLAWLRDSAFGRDEAGEANNHGTWYDVQVATFALFTGADDIARAVIADSAPRRIASQIEPDGRQPRELARTKALSYSTMNLHAFCNLATLGERLGHDLWHYQTADGRGIERAVRWLCATAFGPDGWPYPQIVPMDKGELLRLVRRAARHYGPLPGTADLADAADRSTLLYPPAA